MDGTLPGWVWGIPDSGYRRRAMYRNIPLGFSDTLVGATPSPGLAVFASSRTRLTAWLFSLPLVAVPAHPHRKNGGYRRRSKSFS